MRHLRTRLIRVTLLVLVVTVAKVRAEDSKHSADLVEVIALDPSIRVKLPYATKNNFTKTQLYPVERCFLRHEVATRLVAAHQSLAKHGVGLKIWDGYRPQAVQYRMWEKAPVKGFVGDPNRGSKHNRGAAVDVTLVNLLTGDDLEMPTDFDEFSIKAHRDYPALPPNVLQNRKLLQNTMASYGFQTISKEWWHFDYSEWSKFPLEQIGLEDLALGKQPTHPQIVTKKTANASAISVTKPLEKENTKTGTGIFFKEKKTKTP